MLIGVVGTAELARGQEKSAAATTAPQERTDERAVARHQQINARTAEGDIELVFLGDSITEGWGGAGKDVWERYYGSRKAANMGVGGDQTQHVLWRLEHGNIDGLSPRLVVLMIGTNNAPGDTYTADEIAAGVEAIVRTLRAKLPETKVLVLGVFPRGAQPDAQREKLAAINQVIAKQADEKAVFYLDIGDKFLEPDQSISPEIMPDYLHLSPKGYAIWAEAIEPTVARLLGPTE